MSGGSLELFVDDLLPSGSYVLSRLEVYDWGPFAGLHRADIDLAGTAIIGQTGSGKTTLVDAFMTLICAQPRYNLASTGGHESDRDLVSYVRGVSGAGRSGDSEHIARPGPTLTGIAAHFVNGEARVCIAGLLAMEGSSFAPSDLERVWLFSQRPELGLEDFLEAWHAGGKRAFKQWAKPLEGLDAHDSKKAYLARLRRFFAVGENAFTLLNRAAGLKQLNSIDELFRELVLDDRSAFQRAAEVVEEFVALNDIHEELELARRQQHSLLPIRTLWDERCRQAERLGQARELLQLLPAWYAAHAERLWGERERELQACIAEHEARIGVLDTRLGQQEREEQTLRDRYLQVGGNGIELLREQIARQQAQCRQLERAAGDYRQLTRALGLPDALTAAAFDANRQHAQQLAAERQARLAQQEDRLLELGVAHRQAEQALRDLDEELRQAQARPGSNLPAQYQRFRGELAQALGCADEALPFVAELVEVPAQEARWRGAIERAIGGHRLRLLVPPARLQAVLDWINGRDNRLHVRLLEAAEAPAGEFLADGFAAKLTFKPHAATAALRRLLVEIDRHCVASPEVLRRTPHGMTAEGLMSGREGFFEKQDRSPLDQGWMTGFDNRDRLASLQRQLGEARGAFDTCVAELQAGKAVVGTTRNELKLLERLGHLQFQAIDLPGGEAELASLQRRLDVLTAPDSDASRARQQWEAASEALRLGNAQRVGLLVEKGRLEQACEQATGQRARAARQGLRRLDAHRQALADGHFALPAEVRVEALDELQAQAESALREEEQRLLERLGGLDKRLVSQMGTALREDRGALAEVGTDLDDVPSYLARLQVLSEEALPEKQQRFLAYLNQSSDQSVTQLLGGIDAEVSRIEERIEEINHTMRGVDFQPGCYLQLEPRPVIHESLRSLQQVQRQLRSAALQDDLGESHFRALTRLVEQLRDASERKATQGARALLDPRYRLQFAVSVIERSSGRLLETRTGSQGGSGGEKEIIASYILTASLSYALCPDGSDRPLFGTIVLDEAFSKSSQAVAGRIVSALREFGLHPLFVTPNKEMRLLRAHTRSAILIHRKGAQASMTSLSWEELDRLAQRRRERRDEVAG